MSDELKSKEFTGHSSEMRDSKWLSVEDLLDRGDQTLVIAKTHFYTGVSFDDGRKKDRVFALEFEKAKKQLILNATNRKTLVKRFGTDVSKWAGKSVTLFVEPSVKMKGEVVGGIRIKR